MRTEHQYFDPTYLRSPRRWIIPTLCAVSALTGLAGASYAQSPVNGILGPGDIAASGFAGAVLQSEVLKPGVDPVIKTVIDPDGVTLRIFDGTSFGGAAAGQVVNPGTKLSVKARDIGHVFGLAFDIGVAGSDKGPALFAAATSVFGLHITGPDADGDGKPDRLLKGAAGAIFMEGQFGGVPGAGPGSIWKIDSITGAASLFAATGSGSTTNSGAGIGGIAIDPASRTLYASDLDTGLIHRFGIDQQGSSLGQFDHGVSGRPLRGRGELKDDGKRLDITSAAFDSGKPETWGLTAPGRRVGGLAVRDGRLFYSVAEGPGIWSVGLGPDGAFNGDVRFEVAVEVAAANPVTAIAFDRDGNMILAQRGEVENARDYSAFTGAGPAQVLRYRPDQQDRPANQPRWKPAPEEYAIGRGKEHRGSAGGLAMHYKYQSDGSIDLAACSGTLAASAGSLGPQIAVHGLQLADADLVRPANVPPDQSTVISFDPRLDGPGTRGYAGGVAAFQDCSGAGGSAFPPIADGGAFPPVTDGGSGGGSFPPVADTGDFTFPPVTDDPTTTPTTDPAGGGGKAGVLTITKNAGVDKCSPKGGCSFNIEVRNGTAEPIAGPIVIDELIEAPQAALTGEPNAPWSCTKAAPFKCTHPGPVLANGKLDMRVVFAPNTPPEAKEVRNCARVADGKDAAQAGGPEVGDECATVSLDPNAPVQAGPIVVAKKGAGSCTAKGPCTFTISVTNTSDFEIKDFVVDDRIDAPKAVLAGEPKAPWTCTKAAPFSCTHKGPLAPKATVDLDLSFTPNTPPEKKELKNCAIPPLMGVGGKNPGGAPQQPKQIAPDKKTDLFDFRRAKPLVEPASFWPQSFPQGNNLLHLTGGAGGNIGGVTNNCLEHGLPAGLFIKQSNGYVVTFRNLKVSNGAVTGEAQADTQSCTQFLIGCVATEASVLGRAEGSYDAASRQLRLKVSWNNGAIADYKLVLGADGALSGTGTHENAPGKPQAGLSNGTANVPLVCTRNEICDAYAKTAIATAKKYNHLKCGPDDPPGRYSNEPALHLDWCMSQPPNSPFVRSEAVARDAALKTCEAKAKANCQPLMQELSQNKEEFLRRKCENPPEWFSRDQDSLLDFCVNVRAVTTALNSQLKTALQDCIAKQSAAAGGGAGGGAGQQPAGGGGEPAGGAAEVPPPEPAPEQCAVVPIGPEGQPGAPPAGPEQFQAIASKAGNLSLVKTAKPPCRNNRACDFEVVVTNDGDAEFKGPVEFDDAVTGDGATFGAAALQPPPPAPWACTKGPQGFNCRAELTIAAKASAPAVPFTADLGAGIGAVKEVKNCATLKGAPAPSCATVPLLPAAADPAKPPPVQATPPDPPADPNGLVLTKRRGADKCSDLGGGCAFIVRITNSGLAEFNGPIEFTDVIKTADGQALPNAALESQPLLTLAEGAAAAITCTKAGDTVTCGTGGANAKIPPGQFIDAKLTMKPGPAGGATAVRNCAVLKSGGGQSCSSMALVNGPIVRATKFGGGDTCLPRCTFAVVIQNVGNTDAKGAFKFKDTFTPVSSLGGYTVQPGTGECSRLGDEFFCVPSVNVLKPGELTSVVITVFGAAKAPEYRNCVDFVPQPQAPKESLVLDDKNDGRCVTVKDTSPQTPNLVIRKQAPNRKGASSDGHCDLKSACRFTITVSNTGLAPFTGPLRVTDTVSRGIPQFISIGPGSPQSLPWKCDSVQNGGAIAQSSITCELPPLPNGLAPGTTATLEVAVTPGATWKGSDTLKNCVEITSDGDIGANAQKADCAEVVLDPFSVKVAKTGDQSCSPGSNCTFKITLFNPGPIPHNAPVTITDSLRPGVSAPIVSINPPLPCATQPATIPFSCTSPGNVRLDLDAAAGSEFGPREFTMVVKMPSDGSAESYRNCISVSGGEGEAAEEACHTVATKPVALSVTKTAASQSCDETSPCNFNIIVSNATANAIPGPVVISDVTRVGRTPLTNVKLVSASAPWTCVASAAPGMQCSHPGPVPANGALDLALSLQPLQGSLAGATEVRNCASLTVDSTADARACATIPIKTPAAATPAPGGCSGGMVMGANGLCACPGPTKFNGRECAGTGGFYTNKPGDENPANPPPVATPGQPAPASCSAGMVLSGGLCACPPGAKWTGRECVGTGGGIYTTKPGGDSPKSQPQSPQCPDGFVGTPPKCCPRGTEFRDGACRGPQSTTPVKTCPEGFIGSPPNCCPRGTEFRDGACRGPKSPKSKETKPPSPPQKCPKNLPVGTFPQCCPVNAQFSSGECRCLSGFQKQGGSCVKREVQPPSKTCPQGQIMVNGKCFNMTIPSGPKPKQPRDCGPGYRALDKPNKYGAYCEAIPEAPKKCPGGYIGTPPNCQPPPVVNPPCPAGWSGTPGNCKPPAAKPAPAPQKCDNGFSGFKPNCTCSGKKEVVNGQCIPKIQ